MSRIAKIAKPDICVITNIGLCHLENLKTRDGILKAKTEVFDFMNPEGTVILNGDDDKLISIREVHGKEPVFFGIDDKDGVYADHISNLGLDGMSCTLHGVKCTDGIRSFDVKIPVPGYHMVYNALAGAVAGAVLGLTSNEIKQGIEKLETIAGRNHIIKENGFTIIDDCYNANPVSMKASIDVIDTAIGRKVCILGDMFELGSNEKQLHFDVGEYLGTKSIDVLITAGRLAKQLSAGAQDYIQMHYNSHECEIHSFETKEEMADKLPEYLKKGDNILVKASHGMQFTEVIEKILEITF
jgi:UDP-N-acetylmuramoyl-tripeptide--D-alanyl-D-alanine ligase